MSEASDKVEAMDRYLSILKELQTSRRKMIERLAGLQAETEESGFENLAKKLGEASARTAENFQSLDEVVDDFEMERNRLNNES